MILDHLDEEAGEARAMLPRSGPARRQALKVCALGTGLADKAVALVYERAAQGEIAGVAGPLHWSGRAGIECAGSRPRRTPDALLVRRRHRSPDITVACVLRFVREAHSEIFSPTRWPTLIGHSDRCETLPVFEAIAQPFSPPR